MKNVLIVHNINKRSKKYLKEKKKIIKFLIKRCSLFRFVSVFEFDNLNISEFDTIITLGGDGTIHRVLSAIVNTDKKLGIIPFGTANLLAYNLGIKADTEKALRVLDDNNTGKIDVLKVNNQYSILRVGIGFDADVISIPAPFLKKHFGYFAYVIAGIWAVLTLKKIPFEIQFNGQTIQENASGIIIANAPNIYKNKISTAANSSLNDGLADIFIMNTCNPFLFFIELLKIIFNIKKSNKLAKYFKADTITLKKHWENFHIDGETINLSGNIDISVLKKAVNIYIPKLK